MFGGRAQDGNPPTRPLPPPEWKEPWGCQQLVGWTWGWGEGLQTLGCTGGFQHVPGPPCPLVGSPNTGPASCPRKKGKAGQAGLTEQFPKLEALPQLCGQVRWGERAGRELWN